LNVCLNNSGSWNKYSYVNDDPINGYDPTGRDCQLVSDGNGVFHLTCTSLNPIGGGGGGGGGEGPPVEVGPSEGSGGNAGGASVNRAAALYPGFGLALAKLTGDCASDVIGNSGLSVKYAHDILDSTVVLEADLGSAVVTTVLNDDGSTTNSVGEFTIAHANGKLIAVNSLYFPDPTAKNIKSVDGSAFSALQVFNSTYLTNFDTAAFQALFLLHELSHVLGRPDDQHDLQATVSFNSNLIRDCFK
jgi:hypothetical protein